MTTPAELTAALLKRPMPLVRTFTENLMAYALGRRVEYFDQPTIRAIAKAAEANDYKMSSFILGVDQERRVPDEAGGTGSTQTDCRRREPADASPQTSRRRDDELHHRKAPAPPHVPPRRGRDRGAAVPRRDGAGRARIAQAPRRPTRTRLVCIEEVHGLAGCNNWGASKYLFAPETTGRDFTLVPDNPLQHARAVSATT